MNQGSLNGHQDGKTDNEPTESQKLPLVVSYMIVLYINWTILNRNLTLKDHALSCVAPPPPLLSLAGV